MTWIDPTNVTNIPDYISWVNNVADGWLGNLILMAVFFVALLTLKTEWEMNKSFATASIITALTSIFLYTLGLIQPGILALCIILAIIGFVSIIKKD